MDIFNWIAASLVIASMLYLTFALTLPQWMDSYRKGEAVSLVPARAGQARPMWMQYVLLVVGIALAILLFYYLWTPFVELPEATARILQIIGLLLYIAGFGFLMWARRTLGRHWGVSTSLQAKLHPDHELIMSGPYARVRHPMYFGGWVLMFGLVLLYPTWVMLILFISMLASLLMRARREEAALEERFGEKWEEYKKRTRFMIPFLY